MAPPEAFVARGHVRAPSRPVPGATLTAERGTLENRPTCTRRELPPPGAAATPPNLWRARHYRPRQGAGAGSFLAREAGSIFEGTEAAERGAGKTSTSTGDNGGYELGLPARD